MRRLVTGSIKAILAIAALSTAAHWAMRMHRAPSPLTTAIAAIPDPLTTGSIEPRRLERVTEAPKEAPKAETARGLDQRHLSMLIANAGTAAAAAPTPKPAQKTVAKTPAKR